MRGSLGRRKSGTSSILFNVSNTTANQQNIYSLLRCSLDAGTPSGRFERKPVSLRRFRFPSELIASLGCAQSSVNLVLEGSWQRCTEYCLSHREAQVIATMAWNSVELIEPDCEPPKLTDISEGLFSAIALALKACNKSCCTLRMHRCGITAWLPRWTRWLRAGVVNLRRRATVNTPRACHQPA